MGKTNDQAKRLTERGRFWKRHLERWRKSSLTQSEYCRRHDLSVAAFGWWKRLLFSESKPVRLKQSARSSQNRRSQKGSFVEVHVADLAESIQGPTYAYEIRLSGNRGIRVRSGFDELVLQRLIGVLEQTC